MRIHMIGIGGIGISSLAQYYLEKGNTVSGSDLERSEVTDFLQKKGVKIFLGNSPDNLQGDVDLVVFSPAVKATNPELVAAKNNGIPTKSYPEALGELTRHYRTIAISGSHGKSTTTAMIGLMLVEAGLDPTVIVGTKLREFGNSNFRMGKGNYLVIEACEYDDSFSNYKPYITVVTNIDREHLDYFKTFANAVKTFKEFILKLPNNGFLVANKDDKNLVKISKGKFSTQYYSLKDTEVSEIKKMLKIPGMHNVSNALAVLQVGRILKIKDPTIYTSLSQYQGSWRRFEVKQGSVNNKEITVVSDYAHHPNEILATLTAAREKFGKRKIWCIFQPHQYQRTFYLFEDFVKVFKNSPIDNIIITDIYDVAGREEKNITKKVSSENLVKKVNKASVRYMSLIDAEKIVKENIQSDQVLIIMGAGDVYKLFDKF